MVRALLLPLSLALALLTACNDAGEALPSSPGGITVAGQGSCPMQIAELIGVLFPGGLNNAATQQCNNIERQLGRGETADAIDKVFDLIGFALAHWRGDRLLDPPGPTTTEEALTELLNALLAFVGLDPILPAEGLGDSDFAIEICEAGETCEVVTDTKFAGIRATFLEQVLVVISRLPDDPGPFETFGFDDFPLFYEISVTGLSSTSGPSSGLTLAQETPVAPGAVAGVCVVDPPDPFAPDPEVVDDLRLAHVIEGEQGPEVEILPLADADFLDCTGAATETPPVDVIGLDWWGRRARAAFEPVSEFLVAPLFASPGRLGGAITAFSRFGAVDRTTGGEPVSTPTTTTLKLNGQTTNLTLFQGQTGTATATVDPPPGNELEPLVNFFWPTFSGGMEPTTARFLDDGEASLDFLCDAQGTLTPGEGVVEVGSGARFVRAEFPGAGVFAASASSSLILSCLAPPE